MNKRTFFKILFYGIVSFAFPFKIFAVEKRIINPNLTEEQKNIMFKGGTERAGTSVLNYEKRKGSYHCANCNAKLFDQLLNYSGTDGHHFPRHCSVFKTKVDYSWDEENRVSLC